MLEDPRYNPATGIGIIGSMFDHKSSQDTLESSQAFVTRDDGNLRSDGVS